MSINVSTKFDQDILRVVAQGKDENLNDVKEYGLNVINQAISFGCRKILCDERELEYNLSTIDAFESAKFISENAPKVAKVALVCNPKYLPDAKFWETVSLNRGLTIKVFTKIEEAEDWLNL